MKLKSCHDCNHMACLFLSLSPPRLVVTKEVALLSLLTASPFGREYGGVDPRTVTTASRDAAFDVAVLSDQLVVTLT